MAKFAHDEVVPYQHSQLDKKEQVADMFNSIAYRYDFMNRFLSAGIDVWWRIKAISQLKGLAPKQMLDVATGTGDVAILTYQILHPQKITGIDISEGMLADAMAAFRKRVAAYGLIHYDRKERPKRITVEELHTFKTENLPSVKDVIGLFSSENG